jgi:hypothetical protein
LSPKKPAIEMNDLPIGIIEEEHAMNGPVISPMTPVTFNEGSGDAEMSGEAPTKVNKADTP